MREDHQQHPLWAPDQELVTKGCAEPTVQGNAGHVDEVQEVKGHQVNSSEEAHGWEGRTPVPAERALLLQSHVNTEWSFAPAGPSGEEPGHTFLMKLTWHSPFWTSGGQSGGTGAPTWALWRSKAYNTGERKLTVKTLSPSCRSSVTGKSWERQRRKKHEQWWTNWSSQQCHLSSTYISAEHVVRPPKDDAVQTDGGDSVDPIKHQEHFLLPAHCMQTTDSITHCEIRIWLNKRKSIRGPTLGPHKWGMLWYRSSCPRRSSDTTSH